MHNNKFKVIIVGATILIVAFICISGYKYAQRYKNAQALDIVENFALNADKTYQEIHQNIEKSYLDKDKIFLAKDLNHDQIDQMKHKANNFKNEYEAALNSLSLLKEEDVKKYKAKVISQKANAKKIVTLFQKLQVKFNRQDAVNQLFEQAYLNGDQQNHEVAIKQNIKQTDIEQVKKNIHQQKTSSAFDQALNKGIEFATSQLDAYNQAMSLYTQLYKDKKPTDQVNAENYQNLLQLIQQIKNTKLKESFNEGLKAIEEKVRSSATNTESASQAQTNSETNESSIQDLQQNQNNNIANNDGTTNYEGYNAPNYQVTPSVPQQNQVPVNPTPTPNPSPQPTQPTEPTPTPEVEPTPAPETENSDQNYNW